MAILHSLDLGNLSCITLIILFLRGFKYKGQIIAASSSIISWSTGYTTDIVG
jgi:hypothetical protein